MVQVSSGSIATLVAIALVASASVYVQAQGDDSDSIESQLKSLFQSEDPEIKELLTPYFDSVPVNHQARNHANRCFLMNALGDFIGNVVKGFGKSTPSFSGAVVGVFSAIQPEKPAPSPAPSTTTTSTSTSTSTSTTTTTLKPTKANKDDSEIEIRICEDCGECPPVKQCVDCKKDDCETCPPCPMPPICPVPKPSSCPGKPECEVCKEPPAVTGRTTPKPTTKAPTTAATTSKLPSTLLPAIKAAPECDCRTTKAPHINKVTTRKARPPTSSTAPPKMSTTAAVKVTSTTPRAKVTSTTLPAKVVSTTMAAKISTTKAARVTTTLMAKVTTTTRKARTTKRVTTAAPMEDEAEASEEEEGQREREENEKTTTTTTTTTTVTTTTTKKSVEKFKKVVERNKHSMGVKLFEKNFPLLVKNETLRNNIMALLGEVPATTGGFNSKLAARLLDHFGEKPPNLIKGSGKKGHLRSFTIRTANVDAIMVMGHLMERVRRKKCFCPACKIAGTCECPPVKPCTNRPTCAACPTHSCPAPPGCPQHPPCPKCPEYADDDGDVKLLDDVDPVNPISPEELITSIPCKGFACEVEKTCGEAGKNALTPKGSQSGYMNGGEDELYGEFPSYAHIDIDIEDGTKGLCGGVLISNRHVLTAQHCVRGPNGTTKTKPDQLQVYLADHSRSKKDEFEQEVGVKDICFGKNFVNTDMGSRYDFAVLTLDKTVAFNDNIQPACLPHKPFDPKPSNKCYVVGLGVSQFDARGNSTVPDKVQKMKLNRVSCKSWGIRHDDRSRHCFTKAGDKGDTCGGDSGGPILCINKAKRWTVMGLVSYGSEACDGTETNGWVAVYTRIPTLMKQLQNDCGV